MKEKIEKQISELIVMLGGGYTTDLAQIKRLLGIITDEENVIFMSYIESLKEIGSIEFLDETRIYII